MSTSSVAGTAATRPATRRPARPATRRPARPATRRPARPAPRRPAPPATPPPAPPGGRRPAVGRLLRSELGLVFRRRRNLVLLAVLALVPVLIGTAVALSSSSPEAGEGPPFIERIAGNGLFLVLTSLVAVLPLFLPLAVGVVSGDAVAGEANLGTLRYLLVVPVRRGGEVRRAAGLLPGRGAGGGRRRPRRRAGPVRGRRGDAAVGRDHPVLVGAAAHARGRALRGRVHGRAGRGRAVRVDPHRGPGGRHGDHGRAQRG